MLTPSSVVVAFIKSYEKCSLKTYIDQAGKPTIGWGHLILPDEDFSDGISQEDADALFFADLHTKAAVPVDRIISADLSQQQFDACLSFCFNVGETNFQSSHLAKFINSGHADAATIALEFSKWCHVRGESGQEVISNGLLERRRAEADIYINGNYVNHN